LIQACTTSRPPAGPAYRILTTLHRFARDAAVASRYSPEREVEMNRARFTSLTVLLLAAALAAQEFDFETVRSDFFAGAVGDAAALQRAMTVRSGRCRIIRRMHRLCRFTDSGRRAAAGAGRHQQSARAYH
jgi:hypothetical protein